MACFFFGSLTSVRSEVVFTEPIHLLILPAEGVLLPKASLREKESYGPSGEGGTNTCPEKGRRSWLIFVETTCFS